MQLVRSVVELDPSFVDLHRAAELLRGVHGASQGAGDDHIGSWQQLGQARHLRATVRRQRLVRASEVPTSPVGLGLTMSDEEQHHDRKASPSACNPDVRSRTEGESGRRSDRCRPARRDERRCTRVEAGLEDQEDAAMRRPAAAREPGCQEGEVHGASD